MAKKEVHKLSEDLCKGCQYGTKYGDVWGCGYLLWTNQSRAYKMGKRIDTPGVCTKYEPLWGKKPKIPWFK